MKRQFQLPDFHLSQPQQLWLEEAYRNNKAGKIVGYEHIRIALEGKIPNDFSYRSIDYRLLEHNGTSITIPGILSIREENNLLDDINKVAMAIRGLIVENVDRRDIAVTEISSKTNFTLGEVGFYINLLNLADYFSAGGSMETDSSFYKSIHVGPNEKIFNNYMGFPGIEVVLTNKLQAAGPQPGPSFSQQEIFTANQKLDIILERLQEMKNINELQWFDLKNDINEMRNLYSIPKKNWFQLLAGKLSEMIASGIISDTISKDLLAYFSGVMKHIGL